MYGTDKDNMNDNKNDIYKFNCIYSITQKDGCKFKYSKEKKVILGYQKLYGQMVLEPIL